MNYLQESKKMTEQLKNEPETSHQHQTDAAESKTITSAEIKDLQRQLNEQQDDSRNKDKEFQSLRLEIQSLQNSVARKDSTVSSFEKKVNKLTLDLEEEKKRNCEFQRNYDAAVLQQQEEAEKLEHLTRENQQLASENKRLQDELEAALNKSRLNEEQLQEDGKSCSRSEEAFEKERACNSRAGKKIQRQKKELSEKTPFPSPTPSFLLFIVTGLSSTR